MVAPSVHLPNSPNNAWRDCDCWVTVSGSERRQSCILLHGDGADEKPCDAAEAVYMLWAKLGFSSPFANDAFPLLMGFGLAGPFSLRPTEHDHPAVANTVVECQNW